MKYTEFGEYFKILRIKNSEVLADASKFLGVSSAFVSAVERGKKQIPEDWKNKIIEHYNLNEKEQEKLTEVIDLSKHSIKIDMTDVTFPKKNLAIQFQRSFDNLDDKTAEEILEIIRRNKK